MFNGNQSQSGATANSSAAHDGPTKTSSLRLTPFVALVLGVTFARCRTDADRGCDRAKSSAATHTPA